MNHPASYAESSITALRDLLMSDNVNEVVINPDQSVWVEYSDKPYMERCERTLDAADITNLGTHLASETGNVLGTKHPIVSGRIQVFGRSMRVQIVVPPAIETGVSVSIRKYINRVLDIEELAFLRGKPLDVEADRRHAQQSLATAAAEGDARSALRTAIANRMNILVSGGTSTGKTTLARALLAMTSHHERIVTIEDATELHPPHPNQVALITERIAASERSPARLLECALRMRPDRLILGEIRGPEALHMLEAINTGHPGSISTIHADTPRLALERLALMVMRTGIRLSREDVLAYAARTIDVIIQVGRIGARRGLLQIDIPALALAAENSDRPHPPIAGAAKAQKILQPVRAE